MPKKRLGFEWMLLAICCCFALCFKLCVPAGMPSAALSATNTATNASTAAAPITLPILMYHSLLKNPARANEYVLSPDVFEADLVYLQKQGYQTILMRDLIAYVFDGTALPEKPVMITFDDGHLNNLSYALPILLKHKATAVLSVVGAFVEAAERQKDPNPQYAYVTWKDIGTLHASGCFEIQNHSYNLHQTDGRRGITRKAGEALAQYESVLHTDVMRMQRALSEHAGITPSTFTYPYGFVDQEGERILRELGFCATLSCFERLNSITRNPDCLFSLGRYNRPAGISTQRFMKKVLGE
ncbi:MAG: polysaccharide deacetylase family protein [Clostridia bacterium]